MGHPWALYVSAPAWKNAICMPQTAESQASPRGTRSGKAVLGRLGCRKIAEKWLTRLEEAPATIFSLE